MGLKHMEPFMKGPFQNRSCMVLRTTHLAKLMWHGKSVTRTADFSKLGHDWNTYQGTIMFYTIHQQTHMAAHQML